MGAEITIAAFLVVVLAIGIGVTMQVFGGPLGSLRKRRL